MIDKQACVVTSKLWLRQVEILSTLAGCGVLRRRQRCDRGQIRRGQERAQLFEVHGQEEVDDVIDLGDQRLRVHSGKKQLLRQTEEPTTSVRNTERSEKVVTADLNRKKIC